MFAATCVLLSSLGHVLMSGTSVPWWTMAAAFAVTSATGWVLAGRERGLLAITSATVAAQIALHSGFSLAQAAAARPSAPGTSSLASLTSLTSPGALTSLGRRWAQYLLCAPPALLPQSSSPPDTGGHTQHVMHAAHSVADGTAPLHSTGPTGPMGSMASMGSMSPLGMLAGHLLAALVCGLWLAYGERGAFRVLRAVAALLLVPLRLLFRLPAPAYRPRIRFPREHRVRTPRRLLLADALTSRGPPHGTAVI
ncbi:hypothetical protein [Streptomyces sp. NBC_00096]|uniref:hypothetical protein n=1 Tax=Streptomyces sp. NBC_00096 TaxID=2975650 RepID=UPI00324D88F0